MAEPRLLIVGSANMELSLRVSRFPAAGEHIVSEGAFQLVPGGRAGNAAACAAKLGTDVLFCTRIGNDLNGRTLKAHYDSFGIDTRFVKMDRSRPTALYQTIREGNRDRSILFSGAGSAISDDDLEDAFMAFPDGVLLHFDQNEYLFRLACELAAEAQIPVFADGVRPAFDYPLSMPKLEAIVLDEAETQRLTDIYPDCLDNYVRACMRLQTKINANYFVLRINGKGTYISDGKYSEIVSLPNAAGEIADTPDVFTAALAGEYLHGKSITEAVEFAGVVCAYLSLNRGSDDPYPTRKQLQGFRQTHGIR